MGPEALIVIVPILIAVPMLIGIAIVSIFETPMKSAVGVLALACMAGILGAGLGYPRLTVDYAGYFFVPVFALAGGAASIMLLVRRWRSGNRDRDRDSSEGVQ